MLKEKTKKMSSYLLLIIYVVASSLGMVLIKKGGSNTKIIVSKLNFDIQISWIFIIGICLYILSFLLWIFILQMFPLTYISPVAYGLVFIFIAVFSYLFLSSSITKLQLISAILIISGIVIGTIGTK
jgi:drug/metabolite transporter (DMT)-like permease